MRGRRRTAALRSRLDSPRYAAQRSQAPPWGTGLRQAYGFPQGNNPTLPQIRLVTADQAKRLLQLHAFASQESISDPAVDQAMERGFLGSLRPYIGLNPRNFDEVMGALKVLAPEFAKDNLDREIVQSVWSICNIARAWGLEEDGMLRRNNLITEPEMELLAGWIRQISWTVEFLLMGDTDTAFSDWRGG